VSAFPAVVPAEMPSTATQYAADAHDTDSREFPISRLVALDQVPWAVDEGVEENVVEVAAPPELLGTVGLLLHALISAPASRQATPAPVSLVTGSRLVNNRRFGSHRLHSSSSDQRSDPLAGNLAGPPPCRAHRGAVAG